jgi:hypothetical protein
MTAGKGKYKAMKKAWLEFKLHNDAHWSNVNLDVKSVWMRGFNAGWKKGRRAR